MKKILILCFMLAMTYFSYGQTEYNLWPIQSGAAEGFPGTVNDQYDGIWVLNGKYWILSTPTAENIWTNGPNIGQSSSGAATGYAQAVPSENMIQDAYSLMTPNGHPNSQVDGTDETVDRIILEGDYTGSNEFKYKLVFDWKNDFRQNSIMNQAWQAGKADPLEGLNNVNVRLMVRGIDISADNSVDGFGGDFDNPADLAFGWTQIWNEDFPDRPVPTDGIRTLNTDAITTANTEGMLTYIKNDVDQTPWPQYAFYDGLGIEYAVAGAGRTLDYANFNNATDYWNKYGGFYPRDHPTNDNKQVSGTESNGWFTSEILIAGDETNNEDQLPWTLSAAAPILGQFDDDQDDNEIAVALQFAFIFDNLPDGAADELVTFGDVGGIIAIDNFRIVRIVDATEDVTANQNIQVDMYGRAVNMADNYEDSTIVYTQTPLTLIPNFRLANAGFTLETDADNIGAPVLGPSYFFARYAHDSINAPEGNLISFGEIHTNTSAAIDAYLQANYGATVDSLQDFDSVSFYAIPADEVYSLANTSFKYHSNIKVAQPIVPTENPKFNPSYIGRYKIYFENDIVSNQGDHAKDTVYTEMTKYVLAKDHDIADPYDDDNEFNEVRQIYYHTPALAEGVGLPYGGYGSVFWIENEEVLSNFDIKFESVAAADPLAEISFLIRVYEWDNVNKELADSDPVLVKQYKRGTGGTWSSYPDVPNNKTPLRFKLEAQKHYIVIAEQKTATDLQILVDSGLGKGSYYTYEDKTSFEEHVGAVLMMRLVFENEAPEFLNTQLSMDNVESDGNYIAIVDDRIRVPAGETFTYVFAATDQDNKLGHLSYSIVPGTAGDWFKVEEITAATYDANANMYGFEEGVMYHSVEIIGQADSDNAGNYDIQIVVNDSLGNADYYFLTDTFTLPISILNQKVRYLPFYAWFDNETRIDMETETGLSLGGEEWSVNAEPENNDESYDFDVDRWSSESLVYSQTWIRGSDLYNAAVNAGTDYDTAFLANAWYTDAIAITGKDYDGNGSRDQEEILISPLINIPSSTEAGTLQFSFKYLTDLYNMYQEEGEIDGDFTTGNPIYGYNMADVYVAISSDLGGTWSDTIWRDRLDAVIALEEPEEFSVTLDDAYIGQDIMFAFIYKSNISQSNKDIRPGFFALTEVALQTGVAEEEAADINLYTEWWNEISYQTPLDQIDPNGYQFNIGVENNGDADVPTGEQVYVTVDVEYGTGTYPVNYTRLFRNWWIIPGADLLVGDSVGLTSEQLIRNFEPMYLDASAEGFYKVTYTMYDWNTSLSFQPEGMKKQVFEFEVTDNILRLDNVSPFGKGPHETTVFSQEKQSDRDNLVHLGGSIGSDFEILQSCKPSNIRMYLPENTGNTEDIEFSVSLLKIEADTTLLWTSTRIPLAADVAGVQGPIEFEDEDYFAGFPTLDPGLYYFVINQYPDSTFNVLVGEGGDRMENWLDGNNWIDVDGKLYNGAVNETRLGAIAVDFVFEAEEYTAPYYLGSPIITNNPNYVYESDASAAAAKADLYRGEFEAPFRLYNGVTSFYIINGRDDEGDLLNLDIINSPGSWVSVERISGTTDAFKLVFDTPENVILEDNYVVVKLYDANTGEVAQPAEEDGLRTIHLQLIQRPAYFNGQEPWKEEFAADPGAFDDNDLRWTWETNGLDLDDIYNYPVAVPFDPEDNYDAEASWHKVTEGTDDWENRMCIFADSRTDVDEDDKDFDFEYDATNYQNEWFISDMLFIPEAADKEKITLSFKWDNDFFKNNGGTVGELFSGDPVNGWNNADIRLWVSLDGGYTYESQPLWGEDRDDITANEISTNKVGSQYVTQINLENFENMWIKLAFQYVGRYGGSFCVDDIMIQQRLVDEFPDFVLTSDVDVPPYKIPARHFIASDIDVNAVVKNVGGDFAYENEVAYVKADLIDASDDESAGKYTEVSSAIETLETDASITDLNFPAFAGSLNSGKTYYFKFDVGAEQGAIWDYELSDNTATSSSFSITSDNYAICPPSSNNMTVAALAPKGEDFELRVDDILTKVGIVTRSANQVFYVTIFNSADELVFKSIPFKTANVTGSSDVQYFGLTYDVRNGELNPETGDIPNLDDVDYGVTLPAGSYRVEINGAAAGISLARGCSSSRPYIELEFGAVSIAWDNPVNPYKYAVAGCYYNSSYNINSGIEEFTRFGVKTNGLDVDINSFKLLDWSLNGYSNTDDDWLDFTDFDQVASEEESVLNAVASAVLTGVPDADWLGTYTYKVDVIDNTIGSKAGEKIFDITIIDALKLTGQLGSSTDYEPDFEDFLNLDPQAQAIDMNWPIDEERYAGGMFRLNFDDTNAGWQFEDSDTDGENDRAAVHGNGADAWLTTPLIYVPELNDVNKSWRLQFQQSNCDGKVTVMVSTDGGTPDSWVTLPGGDELDDNTDDDNGTDWVKLQLDEYEGNNIRLAFVFSGNANSGASGSYISDIQLGWVTVKPYVTISDNQVEYDVEYSAIPNEHRYAHPLRMKVVNGSWLHDNARPLADDETGHVQVVGGNGTDYDWSAGFDIPALDVGEESDWISFTVATKNSKTKYHKIILRVYSAGAPSGRVQTTYNFATGDTKATPAEFKTSDGYMEYPRFETNGNGIFGRDKAASFNTGDLTKITLSESKVSFDLIAEDWLSYILVLMDEDDVTGNDDVMTFFIDTGSDIITESFAVSEGMDMSDGVNGVTLGAVTGNVKWFAYDIDDILLSANSSVSITLKDDLNTSSTKIYKDGSYKGDPAIRLFLSNEAPNITNVEQIYHYPVCSEVSINVTAEDDHDASSDIDFALSGFDSDWLTITENGDGTATISGTASIETIGHNRVVIEAEDSEGDKSYFEFDLVVHDIAPEFATTPDEGGSSVVEGMAYSYDADVVDDNEEGYVWDGSATLDVTYSPVQVPAGMTVDAATGLVSWTPSGVVADGKESQDFEVIIGATVSAGCKSEMIEQTYMLTVFKNHPPVMNNVADVWTYVGADFSLQISGTDQNEDALTYAASPLPAGLAIDAATGIISGVPTQNEDIDVTATANDGLLDSDPVTFTIHVTGESTGDAFAVSFEDATANVGERIMIPITAPAGATVGIVKNEATFLSLVIDGDNNYMLSGVATTNVLDTFAITVSATDYSNDDYAEHSGLVVITPNQAPSVDLELDSVYAVGTVTTVVGSLVDAEGDAINVISISAPQWLSVEIDGSSITGTINVENVKAGESALVEIIISDGISTVAYSKEIEVTDILPMDIETVEGSKISVYPNPAQEFIYVEGAKLGSEVLLINATGQILARETVTENVVEINVNSYASGLYMIQVDGISNEVIISNK